MLPEKRKPASGKTGSHEMMIWTDQSSEDSGAVLERQAARVRSRVAVSDAVARRIAELAFNSGRAAA